MPDKVADFEISDNQGSTVVESGTATTTPSNVPASAGTAIAGIGVDNTGNGTLEVSMDGGTTFKTVSRGDFFAWNILGEITQLVIKTPSGSTTYEIVLNREPT